MICLCVNSRKSVSLVHLVEGHIVKLTALGLSSVCTQIFQLTLLLVSAK